MSRYFNSIARQAGVRFADQKGRSDLPAAQSLKPASVHEPLDKSEVVMLTPNQIALGEKAASRDPEPPTKAIATEPSRKKRIKNLAGEKIPVTPSPLKEEAGQD